MGGQRKREREAERERGREKERDYTLMQIVNNYTGILFKLKQPKILCQIGQQNKALFLFHVAT